MKLPLSTNTPTTKTKTHTHTQKKVKWSFIVLNSPEYYWTSIRSKQLYSFISTLEMHHLRRPNGEQTKKTRKYHVRESLEGVAYASNQRARAPEEGNQLSPAHCPPFLADFHARQRGSRPPLTWASKLQTGPFPDGTNARASESC